jgi:hypothetical protein
MAERSNAIVLKTIMGNHRGFKSHSHLGGVLAQLVERLICTEKVKSSNLLYSRVERLEAGSGLNIVSHRIIKLGVSRGKTRDFM